jgi:hypothetical protein
MNGELRRSVGAFIALAATADGSGLALADALRLLC